jgi:magnesium-transporting ATPase (P-type)
MTQPLASTAPTALAGLTSEQAVERLARDGPNLLPGPRPRHPALELLRQLTHLFAVMLWAAAGMALLAGMPQLAVAIVVVVAVNGVFAFLQEYRADRARPAGCASWCRRARACAGTASSSRSTWRTSSKGTRSC